MGRLTAAGAVGHHAGEMGQLLALNGGGGGRGRLGSCSDLLPAAFRSAGSAATVPIAEGDAGTEQTLQLIRHAIDAGLRDPVIRSTALQILQTVPAHDDYAECKALYDWVLDNIRYTKDPIDYETVSDARWTLENRGGDCDDINGVLLPALLMVTGHPVRLVTISSDPRARDSFSHIYAEVYLDDRDTWLPIDAARTGARFGLGPQAWFRKRVWSVSDNSFDDLPAVAGLAGYMNRPARRLRLGDTATDIAAIIGAAGSTAASIISANANANRPATTCIPGTPGCYGPLPVGSPYASPIPAAGGMDTQTLMLFGGAALLLVLVMKK